MDLRISLLDKAIMILIHYDLIQNSFEAGLGQERLAVFDHIRIPNQIAAGIGRDRIMGLYPRQFEYPFLGPICVSQYW
jgi:hypothetical protein